MPDRPTVAVDLDGTLAEYDGWRGVEHFGEPFEGAKDFLTVLSSVAYVVVYTTRVNPEINDGGSSPELDECERRGDGLLRRTLVGYVELWLKKHGLPYDEVYSGPGKPMAKAYVDDRAVRLQPAKDGKAGFARALSRVNELLVEARREKTPVEKTTGEVFQMAADGYEPTGEVPLLTEEDMKKGREDADGTV